MFDDVKPEVSEVSLKTLTDKANDMVRLEELVEEKQASLKLTQKELKVLSEEEIPALLSEVGLSEILRLFIMVVLLNTTKLKLISGYKTTDTGIL